jgi:Uma2 family endonuclease
MTQPQAIDRCTPEEYLRREQAATEKHEYYDGEVFAMAGGTFEHSRIIANVIGELRNRLNRTPCGVQDSNLRVKIPRNRTYAYPDASVVCGPPQFDPADSSRQSISNPTLLVEVLSPSTETWDRGGKFDRYREIESLREYVLVAWDAARVETFLRREDGTWTFAAAIGMEAAARLNSVGAELPLAEVYRGVELPAPAHWLESLPD